MTDYYVLVFAVSHRTSQADHEEWLLSCLSVPLGANYAVLDRKSLTEVSSLHRSCVFFAFVKEYLIGLNPVRDFSSLCLRFL